MWIFGGKGKADKESEHDVVGEYPVRAALQRAISECCLLAAVVKGARFSRRARIVGLEDAKTPLLIVRFYENVDFSPGDPIEGSLESSEWRYSFETRIDEIRDDIYHLCPLPDALRDAERRSSGRIRFRKSDGIQVAAITDTKEGVAVSGGMRMLSTSGLVFAPHGIAEVSTQEDLIVGREHFRFGRRYKTVRVKLPGAARDTVVAAVVKRTYESDRELQVAMEIEELPDADRRIIDELVEMRAPRAPVRGPLFPDEKFQAGSESDKEGEEASRSAAVLLVGNPLATCSTPPAALEEALSPVAFRSAVDARGAIQFLTQHRALAIVLRLSEAGVQNPALIRLFRSQPGLAEIPILVVSPPMGSASVIRLKSNGVTDVFAEPVEGDAFLQRIKKLTASPKP